MGRVPVTVVVVAAVALGLVAVANRRPVMIDGTRHLWWVARTPPIRHRQISGERVLCRSFATAPRPRSAGQND